MVTELFSSGHTACVGCGQALGARLVVETTGPNVIIANATGCLEVFTSRYPESAWGCHGSIHCFRMPPPLHPEWRRP